MYLKSVDLDNFPTNKTAQRMLSRVSPIYDRSYVMKWFYQVMGAELEAMSLYVKAFPLQRFPETATWGIGYLEQKYDIPVDESLSLEERRERILSRRPYRGAANPYYIEQVVKKACGAEVEAEEHNDEYYFDLHFKEPLGEDGLGKMLDALNKVKPSHLGTNCRIKAPPVNSEHFFASGMYIYHHIAFEQFIPAEKRLYSESRLFHLSALRNLHGYISISRTKINTYNDLNNMTYGALKDKTYTRALQE